MAWYLRMIRAWRAWDARDWLSGEEALADCLRDLRTEDGRLSIWDVGDGSEANVHRVVAGLAAGRDRPDRFFCLVFDGNVLKDIGLKTKAVEGENCADEEVAKRWHRDVTGLTVRKVAAMACSLWHNQVRHHLAVGQVKTLIRRGVETRCIAIRRMRNEMRAKVLGEGPS